MEHCNDRKRWAKNDPETKMTAIAKRNEPGGGAKLKKKNKYDQKF